MEQQNLLQGDCDFSARRLRYLVSSEAADGEWYVRTTERRVAERQSSIGTTAHLAN